MPVLQMFVHMWKAVSIGTWNKKRTQGISSVKETVGGIIEKVRNEGDRALISLTEQFDHVTLDHIRVSEEELDAAYEQVDTRLIEYLIEAETRISRFHQMQMPKELWLEEVEPGVVLGVKTTPMDRIGAYIPGGRAAYPSTALMCAIPARVAGVSTICCCSPPPIQPLTLVAMDIAGVDEVYSVGGAQAVAAMALGTESIKPVEKIVGPGNVFVTMAKMLLRDSVEIDFPAGPSEIAILADSTGNPRFIAADILAQAEHDPDAACILVTTDEDLAYKVWTSLQEQLRAEPRLEIIEKALENAGFITAASLTEGIDTINALAPEHLSIQVADPLSALSGIRNAGSVFVGQYAAVACGDYSSGTNHVLPTAGYARMYSGLDVHHFCKRSSVQAISREGLESIGDVVEGLADAEGLHAHAESVRIRRKNDPEI